jgi:hypothetical protein
MAPAAKPTNLSIAKHHPDENIRLEPEVMRHYGREDIGVALPDRDGYIGTLNVFHELHCIVWIKKPIPQSET